MDDSLNITLNDLRDAKEAFERRVVNEVVKAAKDFYNTTGLTPSDVDVRMVDTTSFESQLQQYTVADVEISRDRFPRF